ncbi:MAG: hypothetical protein KF767_18990 [Bdellovibrionaceae bacterium]|nr:hypothetical protein [Pseudobdellovibrionaceae bacterium]
MGLDLVVMFCVVYSGLVLTGMWFYLSPPKGKLLRSHEDFLRQLDEPAPSARILEFRRKSL